MTTVLKRLWHSSDPDQLKRWMAFLRNHKDGIAAMGLFTVPAASLRVLYGFFVIDHSRRRILHFNAIFSAKMVGFVRAMGINPCRNAYRSPWQNGVSERWIGSCRRELLDHVIVFDRHLFIRLLRSYLDYSPEDRCHLGLDKDAPSGRVVTARPSSDAKIIALPRVGGIHRQYAWRDAA